MYRFDCTDARTRTLLFYYNIIDIHNDVLYRHLVLLILYSLAAPHPGRNRSVGTFPWKCVRKYSLLLLVYVYICIMVIRVHNNMQILVNVFRYARKTYSAPIGLFMCRVINILLIFWCFSVFVYNLQYIRFWRSSIVPKRVRHGNMNRRQLSWIRESRDFQWDCKETRVPRPEVLAHRLIISHDYTGKYFTNRLNSV